MPKNEVSQINLQPVNSARETLVSMKEEMKDDITVIRDSTTTAMRNESKSAWRTLRNLGKEVKHDTAKAFRSMKRKMSRKANNSVKEITLEQEDYEDPRWACKSAESTGSRNSELSCSNSNSDSYKDDEIEVIYDEEPDNL